MQIHDTQTSTIDDNSLFFTPKKKNIRIRKWREIEEIKAQQRLNKELQEIDQSFVYSLSDLV
tara:strand:- start:25036 stop:25221 length:186 start_codon:yes stop_codon:yes gene_type:complete